MLKDVELESVEIYGFEICTSNGAISGTSATINKKSVVETRRT